MHRLLLLLVSFVSIKYEKEIFPTHSRSLDTHFPHLGYAVGIYRPLDYEAVLG
ncbi:hypothetical protein SAMN05216167_101768 [Spirosoma endophyticum]|uniref:Uncharacterized protein n=1 Tax=Spirosoma endophyticum TaxID=662367 RepID=A0A1I1HS61_9BACT|nr:hypothetical protein SAMN05216167_101768 [Spirosoma endophyticum]